MNANVAAVPDRSAEIQRSTAMGNFGGESAPDPPLAMMLRLKIDGKSERRGEIAWVGFSVQIYAGTSMHALSGDQPAVLNFRLYGEKPLGVLYCTANPWY